MTCDQCGFSAELSEWHPALSVYADIRCPKCKSTANEHNRDYSNRIRKAWNCKHEGDLVDAGFTRTDPPKPLLECKECGSIGLSDSMRKNQKP